MVERAMKTAQVRAGSRSGAFKAAPGYWLAEGSTVTLNKAPNSMRISRSIQLSVSEVLLRTDWLATTRTPEATCVLVMALTTQGYTLRMQGTEGNERVMHHAPLYCVSRFAVVCERGSQR